MIKVFGSVPVTEMTDKFGDILQFCSHVSRLMFNEIRRRASNQSTGICNVYIIVSPDESRVYLGFSMVRPPPPSQRFPFGHDISVRPFKFGMWIYMGNATNTIVL